MHNIRCANSKALYCNCSGCGGRLHGNKGTGRGKIKTPEVDSLLEQPNMFCSSCGTILQPAKNIVIKGNKTYIRCPNCAKEWKV